MVQLIVHEANKANINLTRLTSRLSNEIGNNDKPKVFSRP